MGALLEPRHALHVRGGQRLLDEFCVEILEDRESRGGALAVPPFVRVVAERRLRQLELETACQVEVAVEPELHLERAERGGGARLRQHLLRRTDGDGVGGPDRRPGEAEHPPDGLAGLLAGEIPGGGAEAGPQGRHARRRQPLAEHLDARRALEVGDVGREVGEQVHVARALLAVAGVRRALAQPHEVAVVQLHHEALEVAMRPAGDAERSGGAEVEGACGDEGHGSHPSRATRKTPSAGANAVRRSAVLTVTYQRVAVPGPKNVPGHGDLARSSPPVPWRRRRTRARRRRRGTRPRRPRDDNRPA